MKRILLAGSSHVAAAEKLLAPVFATWARKWCLQDAAGTCRIVSICGGNGAGGGDGGVLAQAKVDHGGIVLAGSAEEWRKALFGPALAHFSDDATAAHLGQCARDALLEAVFAALDGGVIADPTIPVAISHCVCIELEINLARLQLLVETTLLEAHTVRNSRVADQPELVARSAAIAPAEVGVRVEMPLLRVAMEDFLGLKPGDVVCSDAGLDAPFSISIGSHRLPVKAALGLQGDRKAIRVDA